MSSSRIYAYSMVCVVLTLGTITATGRTVAADEATTSSPESAGSVVDILIQDHEYDLSRAFSAHQALTGDSPEKTREEILTQVLIPFGNDDVPVRHQEVRPGIYRVWGSPTFHKMLPSLIQWVEHDRKQISIETRIITVDEATLSEIHTAFGPRWTLSEFAEPLEADDEPPLNEFVSGSTSVVRALPVRVVKLADVENQRIVQQAQSETRTNLMQAPKVTIFPGQQAQIADTTQRPFVVSVTRKKGETGTAFQPVIRVFNEGFTLGVRASFTEDDRLRLDGEMNLEEITDVEEVDFLSTRLQIPEQRIQTVRFSKSVESDATLLFDPHFYEERTEKSFLRSPKTIRQHTLVLITTRVIQVEPVESETTE